MSNTPVTPYFKPAHAPAPAVGTPPASGNMSDLLALMARLRIDCPWDKKQDNHSLIPYALEEVYELVDAIQDNDDEDIAGELGDVLLQVVFHCQLYAEQGRFDFADVVQTLQEKLIRRHPHVFDAENLPDKDAVKARWDEIKAFEKAARAKRGKPRRTFDATKAGSALMQAQAIQKQASKLGFDWEGVAGAVDKLDEEIDELKALIPKDDKTNTLSADTRRELEKELGDCLFALVNVARKLDFDAEAAALTCVHKFQSRFAHMETQLAAQGSSVEASSLADLEALWQDAKRYE